MPVDQGNPSLGSGAFPLMTDDRDGPVVLQTLDEYRRTYEISAHCDCGRQVLLTDEVLRGVPGTTLVRTLRQRLRCKACGRRPERIQIGYPGRR